MVTGLTGVDTGLTGVSCDALCCMHLVLGEKFWKMLCMCSGEVCMCPGGVCMCSGGAPLVCCFGGFALCVPMAWSPSCLPCEESVRALLSSDLVFVLCWTFDHLWSLCCFLVVFSFFFI